MSTASIGILVFALLVLKIKIADNEYDPNAPYEVEMARQEKSVKKYGCWGMF